MRLAVVLACCLFWACKPPEGAKSPRDVKIVSREPRCEKLGVIEGVGGSERRARENALEVAAERGATHMILQPAHPDLEDGMAYIVTAKIFDCPPADEQFPPDGYR